MTSKERYNLISLVIILMLSMTGCSKILSNENGNRDEFLQYADEIKTEESNRAVITCLSTGSNTELDKDIDIFNSSQNKYEIVKIVYDGEENYDEWLSKQFASGNHPDIYDVTNGVGSMSIEQCVERGMLEKLDSYFNNDNLDNNDFIPSLYDGMCINGHLYFCAATVSITTLAARYSYLNEITGWDIDEFENHLKNNLKSDIWLFSSNNKIEILNMLLIGCGNDFINWEDFECNFDSTEFIELLKICNRDLGNEMHNRDSLVNEMEMIQAGSQLFKYEESLNPEVMMWDEVLFNGDISYIGFPNAEKSPAFIKYHNALAISNNSSNKAGSWEFVKWRMTKAYQSARYMSIEGTPTRKDVFEQYIIYEQSTDEYIDIYGNTILPNKGAIIRDNLYVSHEAIPDYIIDEYERLIYSSTQISFNDQHIIKIIDEESRDYFNNNKSAEEVASNIQNRISIYLSECK